MKWTLPTWPIGFDLVGYGIVLLAILIAAGTIGLRSVAHDLVTANRSPDTPLTEHDRTSEGARAALLARLRAEPVTNIGGWNRGELYEDDL